MDRLRGDEGPTGPRGKRGPVLTPGFIGIKGGLLLPSSQLTIRHGTGGHLFLDAVPAGQQAELWFLDGGVSKWALYKDGANNLNIYNAALAANAAVFAAANNAATLTSLTLTALTGTGSRMVKADAAGALSALLGEMGDLVYAGVYSGVTAFSLPNGTFDNTKYRNYLITVNNTNSTAAQDLRWRGRVAGTDDAGAGGTYQYAGLSVNGGQPTPGVVTGFGSTGASANFGVVYAGVAGGTPIDIGCLLFVETPADAATRTKVIALSFGIYNGVDWKMTMAGGEFATAKAHDALTLLPGANTITGTVRVAGLRDSL